MPPSLLQMVKLGESMECGGQKSWGGLRDGSLCVFPQEPPFVEEWCRQGVPTLPELPVWMAFLNFMFSGKEIKNSHAWGSNKMKQEHSVSGKEHCFERQQGKQSHVQGKLHS